LLFIIYLCAVEIFLAGDIFDRRLLVSTKLVISNNVISLFKTVISINRDVSSDRTKNSVKAMLIRESDCRPIRDFITASMTSRLARIQWRTCDVCA